ncbi:hypothetical protein Ahy_A10g050447 [Arachis hypogaea]|uniref:Protein FAR1-RELATED SEQUENCE n=1 Tax=Arachis hypogaea TaxID=3818 RepID=A0A445B9D4_ARAHY|nr:hypothetical protein Ahy_A10g050447 [Arachis hypogaea]
MRIDAKGHRDVHANNNSPVVYQAHHKKDPKQIKRLQATRRNQIRDEPCRLELVLKRHILQKLERSCHKFIWAHVLVHSTKLYEDHHLCIQVYLDHHFGVRMRSTQRSEGMHISFNKFITWNSSMIQFVKQYDNCLASREQREREFDAADFHTMISCAIKSAIEAQFQHVYTHKKLRKVQAQFRGKVNCITRSMHSTLGFTTYEVVEQVSNFTFNKFFITYDAVSREVKCQYLLFESRKILGTEIYTGTLEQEHKEEAHTHQEQPIRASIGAEKQEIRQFEFEELTQVLHRAFNNVLAEMQEYQARKKFVISRRSDIERCERPPKLATCENKRSPQEQTGIKLEKKISNATKKKKKLAPSEVKNIECFLVDIGNPQPPMSSVTNWHKQQKFRKMIECFSLHDSKQQNYQRSFRNHNLQMDAMLVFFCQENSGSAHIDRYRSGGPCWYFDQYISHHGFLS